MSERDPDVRPTWSELGLPLCDDACPNYDGKRCKATGFRPDRLCEPMLLQQAEESIETGEALRETQRALEKVEHILYTSRHDTHHVEGSPKCQGCEAMLIARAALAASKGEPRP